MYLMIDLRGFLHSSRGDDRQSTEHINSIALERFVIWWSSERIPKITPWWWTAYSIWEFLSMSFNQLLFFWNMIFWIDLLTLNKHLGFSHVDLFGNWESWTPKNHRGKPPFFWWQKNPSQNEPLGVKFQTLLENLVRSGWFKGPFWRKIILHTT